MTVLVGQYRPHMQGCSHRYLWQAVCHRFGSLFCCRECCTPRRMSSLVKVACCFCGNTNALESSPTGSPLKTTRTGSKRPSKWCNSRFTVVRYVARVRRKWMQDELLRIRVIFFYSPQRIGLPFVSLWACVCATVSKITQKVSTDLDESFWIEDVWYTAELITFSALVDGKGIPGGKILNPLLRCHWTTSGQVWHDNSLT